MSNSELVEFLSSVSQIPSLYTEKSSEYIRMSTAKIITLAQGNGASGSSIPSDSPAHPLQSGEGTGADSGSASVPVPENGQYTPATETSPSALPSTGYVSSLSAISTAIFSNPSTISPPVSAPSSPINTLATSSIIATVTSAAGAPFGTLSSDSGQQAPSQSSIVAGDVTAAQSSASEASPTQTPVTSKSNGLAGGTVAGIVVAVAVAIALLTFLATCFLARRKYTRTQYGRRMEPLSSEKPAPAPISKESAATVSAASSDTMGKHLPQSADDATIRGKVKTVLDQLGLYIENFYQDAVTPGSQSSESDIAIFDSKLLPGQMATLMRTSRKAKPLIQHALDYMIMTSISLTGDPAQSLLPTEFILLPGTIANQKLPASKKPGRCLSCLQCAH